tara:strand:- start:69 stop:257 length:189 start_codon:yes stop_codon:yes gene_type:complete
MTTWTEDSNITTNIYEEVIHSGFSRFDQIEVLFSMLEYKFNEIGNSPTLTEDSYINTTWSED